MIKRFLTEKILCKGNKTLKFTLIPGEIVSKGTLKIKYGLIKKKYCLDEYTKKELTDAIIKDFSKDDIDFEMLTSLIPQYYDIIEGAKTYGK